jgi:hypothetical protein
MLRNLEVARFVVALLPSAIKEGHSHRVLLAFSAACLHEFIKRTKSLDEGTLAFLLPALLEPLQQQTTTPSKDAIVRLCNYEPLDVLLIFYLSLGATFFCLHSHNVVSLVVQLSKPFWAP